MSGLPNKHEDTSEWRPPASFDEYQIRQYLGGGSSGDVYLAHDRLLDRLVAIKFHSTRKAEGARRRFLTEARALARLHHPNVMGIFRVGQLGKRTFIVAEYIRGRALHEFTLPLSWRKAAEYGLELARGLAAAHRHGVLHRDIKLANAIVDEASGAVKLVDFGLAKLLSPRAEGAEEVRERPPSSRAAGSTLEASTEPHDSGAEAEISAVLPGAVIQEPDELLAESPEESASLPNARRLLGTPHYMAPELWRMERATRETDVYAFGVMLYILCTGRPPYNASTIGELATRVMFEPPARLDELGVFAIDERFAGLITRCLERDGHKRPRSGDELREELEALLDERSRDRAPGENPYRGLRTYEAKHRNLFFGRSLEIRGIVERLRASPALLVAGDSGVGKSSLCRAGVAPMVLEGALDRERSWSWAAMMPGRAPLRALLSALAELFGISDSTLEHMAKAEPERIGWQLRGQLGRSEGRLLYVDQLEELITISDPGEVEKTGMILGQLASGIPGVRLLASVRGDFLVRATGLPHVGAALASAIYVLQPLSRDGLRDAIVGPAHVAGARFESEAMIEELIEAGQRSSLPVLQFALAELWAAPGRASKLVSYAELRKIGGVTGALARHADGLYAGLSPERFRLAARALLLKLVTIEDTRASLTADELSDDPDTHAALEVLVQGRLVVAREVDDGMVYELAHEALITGWGALQGWLNAEREIRALRHRVARASKEWRRLGRPRSGLWSDEQMAEADRVDWSGFAPAERMFLDASVRALLRRRRWRVAGVSALAITALMIVGTFRSLASRERARRVDEQVTEARRLLTLARSGRDAMEEARQRSWAAFDGRAQEDGEALWSGARAAGGESERRYREAAQALSVALAYDTGRDDVAALLAEVLYERATLAESTGQELLREELLARLRARGADEQLARWDAPGELIVETTPAGAAVSIATYEPDASGRRALAEARDRGETPAAIELAAGSYRLTLTLPDRPPVLVPVLVERGQREALTLAIPSADGIPEGYVYIPPGEFLYGSADESIRSDVLSAAPLHPVRTEAYLIKRAEVTFADWIEFLEAVSPARADSLLPRVESQGISLALARGEGGWRFTLSHGERSASARAGDDYEYLARSERPRQPWLEMPVTGIVIEDARAYLRWLSRSGRVPGARLCTEHEWERAARGADGRTYPHGERLDPGDANIDATYGRSPLAVGPDAVASYPGARSPFGLEDMAGNAIEWTTSVMRDDEFVIRGGGFFLAGFVARADNRSVVDPNFRDAQVGLRVCAAYSG